MGWIRKQARRVKKKIKKLLSTKFGRIIGAIGLSMAMGWAAGKLFNGAKTIFGGVQGAGAGTAGAGAGAGVGTGATATSATAKTVTGTAVKGAGAGATATAGQTTLQAGLQQGGAEVLGQTTREGLTALSERASTALSNAGSTVDAISQATNNVEAFGNFQELQQAADLTGVGQSTFTNNLSDAVTTTVNDLSAMPNTVAAPGMDIAQVQVTPEAITPEFDFAAGATESATASRTAVDAAASKKTLLQKGGDFVRNAYEDTVDYFKNDFIPDGPGELVGEGVKLVVADKINEYLADDESPYGGAGQVQSVSTQGSQPQGNYLTDITPQYQAAMRNTQAPQMSDVMNGGFYGNMSPQYLQNLNQQMYSSFMPLPPA